MQLNAIPHSVFLPQPPPLWYITNGEQSVGPVVTGMLVRGIEAGRVPDYCHVRVVRGNWRGVNYVREVAALNGRVSYLPAASGREAFMEYALLTGHIKDDDEFLYELAQLAITATNAESAMFHCLERSTRAMVTRCVLGPMPYDRLGRPLPDSDLVLHSARLGRPVFGPPYGPTEDALAMRFASSRGGAGAVAMIPISLDGALTAMLELSRPGHAFRRDDLRRAERVVQRALRVRKN
jgi:hypothetical protein